LGVTAKDTHHSTVGRNGCGSEDDTFNNARHNGSSLEFNGQHSHVIERGKPEPK
jgi:hypothetical protein